MDRRVDSGLLALNVKILDMKEPNNQRKGYVQSCFPCAGLKRKFSHMRMKRDSRKEVP